ncbi:MAG: hypothetical protein MZV64_62715 [Ignavibacteriales bacterium]|nr:hypothetical protein [Ignavibacteriales bacterium]
MTTLAPETVGVKPHTDILLNPHWAEITAITPEADGISTYWLRFTDPAEQEAFRFEPGQFNMLYLPGFGEIRHFHQLRPRRPRKDRAYCPLCGQCDARDQPFESWEHRRSARSVWDLLAHERHRGQGCVHRLRRHRASSLRPALYHIIRNREKYGKVTLLYGARTSGDLMFPYEYDEWRKAGIDVEITVDRGDPNWNGTRRRGPDVVLPVPHRLAPDHRPDLRT